MAVVLTVASAATAVFAVIADNRNRDSYKHDQALVALVKADFQMDRALYTELQNIINSSTTGIEPDQEPLDKATAELAARAKDFGVDNLKLGESEADQQVRLLFEDPVGRVAAARAEIDRGTIAGTKLPATFGTLRAAVYTFAERAPSLFNSKVLADTAKSYADNANPEKTSPPWVNQQLAPDDPRVQALDLLTGFSQAIDQSNSGALWVACGIAGVLAVAAWVVFFLRHREWGISLSFKGSARPTKPAAKPAAKAAAEPTVKASPTAKTPLAAKAPLAGKPGARPAPAAAAKPSDKPADKAAAGPAAPKASAKAPTPAKTTAPPTADAAASAGLKTPAAKPAAAPQAKAAPGGPAAKPGAAAPAAKAVDAKPAGAPSAKPAGTGTAPAAKPGAKGPGAGGPLDPAAMAAAARSRPTVAFQPTDSGSPATPEPDDKPSTPGAKKTPKVPWRTTGEK